MEPSSRYVSLYLTSPARFDVILIAVRASPADNDSQMGSSTLNLPMESVARRQVMIRRMSVAAIAVIFAGACLGLVNQSWFMGERSRQSQEALQEQAEIQQAIDANPVIFDNSTLPIAPDEAQALNAARPSEIGNPFPARPFNIAASDRSAPSYGAALSCLAQTIYYEAGNQSDDGKRAVAQVVLNRVRHPAFPNSVCGVVYQGSTRSTGCQFTFTCDGSLARVPSPAGLARARRIAKDALSGTVFPAVGLATHYHADYVVPYWASSLAKVRPVGAHVFYQMRGSLGSRGAFQARYDVDGETLSAPAFDQVEVTEPALLGDAETDMLDPPVIEDRARIRSDLEMGNLIVRSGELQPDARAYPRLRADDVAGSLEPPPGGLMTD